MIYNICTTALTGGFVDVVKNFSKNVRDLLARRRISQRQLARDLDVHPATLNGWFSGKGNINLKNAQMIADHLRVDVYALCFDFSMLPKLDQYALSTHDVLQMPLYKLAAELGYPRFIQDVE